VIILKTSSLLFSDDSYEIYLDTKLMLELLSLEISKIIYSASALKFSLLVALYVDAIYNKGILCTRNQVWLHPAAVPHTSCLIIM
jgi:hypothetical protein